MIGKEKERGDLFMNKNLKRALNTTAAVSMSLAMVLGAVAPVTNVSAASIEEIVDNKKTIVDLLDFLGDVTAIEIDGYVGELPNATGSDVDKEYTFKEVITKYEAELADAHKYASVVGYNEEQIAALKHLNGVKDGVRDLLASKTNLEKYTAGTKVTDKYDGTHTYLDLYNEVSDLLTYKGNVNSTDLSDLEKIEGLFADLEADVKDYKEDNVSKDAKAFAEKHWKRKQ